MFEATIRSGEYVMAAGTCFAATVLDSNTIQIADGELMMQGRHVKLNPGQTVNLIIESGVLGQNRCDYIVARYIRNANDGIEGCSLVVLKGTPASSGPVAPEIITGDINSAKVLVNDFPLYSVEISGLTLGSPKALFAPQFPLAEELHKFCNESADAPGCYYRTIDGCVEWVNPPMIPNVVYRTTERWNGEPVYVLQQDVHIAAGAAGSFSIMGAAEVVSADLRYRADGVWLDVSNNPNITVESTRINLRPGLKVFSVDEVDIIGIFKYIGVSIPMPPLM